MSFLVIDNDAGMNDYLCHLLRRCGYSADGVLSGEEAILKFDNSVPDVVIEDLGILDITWRELLCKLKRTAPSVPVVLMGTNPTYGMLVDAMRLGGHNLIRKPLVNETVSEMAASALVYSHLFRSLKPLSSQSASLPPIIVGSSRPMRDMLALVHRIAPTDGTLMIRGETGTGKELVARYVHICSTRAGMAFIALRPTSLPDSIRNPPDGSTLFVDSVASLSPSAQAQLLRLIEESEARLNDGAEAKALGIRVISATNVNLEDEVKQGNFREDLFFRLNVIPISVPPLRERREDIPLLAGHFLARYAAGMKKKVTSFEPEAIDYLVSRKWPGNVQELQNVIQRAVALASQEEILCSDLLCEGERPKTSLDPFIDIPPEGFRLEKKLEEIERDCIERALARTDGHIGKAAELLGMTFRSIRYRIEKLGIQAKHE